MDTLELYILLNRHAHTHTKHLHIADPDLKHK